MTETRYPLRHYSPAPQQSMPNTHLDRTIEAVPKFEERILLWFSP